MASVTLRATPICDKASRPSDHSFRLQIISPHMYSDTFLRHCSTFHLHILRDIYRFSFQFVSLFRFFNREMKYNNKTSINKRTLSSIHSQTSTVLALVAHPSPLSTHPLLRFPSPSRPLPIFPIFLTGIAHLAFPFPSTLPLPPFPSHSRPFPIFPPSPSSHGTPEGESCNAY